METYVVKRRMKRAVNVVLAVEKMKKHAHDHASLRKEE